MTAVVVARSRAGLDLVAAARARAGSRGAAVLVSYADAANPELADPLGAALAEPGEFAAVLDLTAEIAPHHALRWSPQDAELPLLRRLLAARWPSGPVDELWVENLDHPPAVTMARIFDTADIHLAGAGLLAYGPPGVRRPQQFQRRIVHRWYRPLVPGLLPVEAVPATAVPGRPPGLPGTGPALILGADLVGPGLLDPAAEAEFHAALVREAAADGGDVAFSPHPAMPPARRWLVERAARATGVAVEPVRGLPDALVGDLAPRRVVGCAAGALLRLHAAGHRASGVGAAGLLQAMAPYHHPDRIPLTIADAVLRADSPYADSVRLNALVGSVAFVMRPDALPGLREATTGFLRGLEPAEWSRYFRRHRAERLGLPLPG